MEDALGRPRRFLGSVEFVAIALSIAAFTVSAYSVLVVVKQHEDEQTAQLTESLFAAIQEISILKLEHRLVRHVFSSPEEYAADRDRLRTAVADYSEDEQLALLDTEFDIAQLHFQTFERMFYTRELAVTSGDETRIEFVSDFLAYYTGLLLRNPRLLWLGSDEGANLAAHLNDPSREYYYASVWNDPTAPLQSRPDAEGLFPQRGDISR